ncbi:MAG: phosphatidylglycerophosphate synthase [Monoraphidium minutum]|nr:MAG: phosphatidylglycerophosphate synthase [Monoraphidium minutum]
MPVSTRNTRNMAAEASASQEPPLTPSHVAGDIPRIPLLGVVRSAEAFDAAIDRRSDFYRLQALSHVQEHPPPHEAQSLINVPNVLTFARLVAVPVVVAIWFAPVAAAALWCACLFVAASFTDWLDGYIARKFEIVTAFGAFLDPVADKIMVTSTLILLTLSPPAPLAPEHMAGPVVLIICREITMSALREWAAAAGGGAHKAVKVNALGKWKTALQMTAMSLLLFCRDTTFVPRVWAAAHVTQAGVSGASFTLLWGSAVLALWSLSTYFVNVWSHFVAPQPAPAKKKA